MPRAAPDLSLVDVLKDIVGDEHVLHTPEDMLVFEFDGSIDRELPQAVVLPSTAEQVSRVVRLAHDHGLLPETQVLVEDIDLRAGHLVVSSGDREVSIAVRWAQCIRVSGPVLASDSA